MTFDHTQWPIYLTLLGLALTCWVLFQRLRQSASQQQSAEQALTQRLTAAELRLQRALEQSAEQARRLAWLELQLHQSSLGSALRNAGTANTNGGNVTSMTERRHRVLALARRGMEADMIAETLGVPKGEIELILALSSLNAAA